MAVATTEKGAAASAAVRRSEYRKEFLALFRGLAPHRRRFQVFSDFVTMSALSLANGILADEKRENEYLEIINSYTELADRERFPKLFALMVLMLELEPHDVLGELYMELEFGERSKGQFFTPQALSDVVSRLVIASDIEQKLSERPFILLSEPACGAGGMILSFFKTVKEKGFNPQQCLWVQAIDVDRVSALMCYIQLSLWHIPAEVIVGNALTLEVREVFKTPAHHLGLWSAKLRQHRLRQDREESDKQKKDFSFSSADRAFGDVAEPSNAGTGGAETPPQNLERESYPYPQESQVPGPDLGDGDLKWDSLPYIDDDQGTPSETTDQSSVPNGTQFDLGF